MPLLLLRFVFITLTILSSRCFGQDDDDIILTPVPHTAQDQKEDDQRRHPLATLVGPHYERYWSKIPFFYVGEGMEKCFYEFVPADINLVVPFFGNKTEQGYICHITIYDNDGLTVAHEVMSPESPVGLLYHKSPSSIQYKICTACGKSSWMSRTQAAIALKIELINEMNTVFNTLPSSDNNYEKNNSSSYQVVNKSLKEAQAELEVAIELEFEELLKQSGTFSKVETMKFRIWVMALITLGCSGLIMIAVVKYLRSFFRREKVI